MQIISLTALMNYYIKTFKYKDYLSKGEWRTQHCTVESINECIRIYGLDEDDVEWELISAKEVEE